MNTTDTKEHPILFTGEMVRANHDGRKTQTRRVMKVQPSREGLQMATVIDTTGDKNYIGKSHWVNADNNKNWPSDGVYFKCPYGQPGDQLWVRETFQTEWADGAVTQNYKTGDGYKIVYIATEKKVTFDPYTPSIHMPRWASRINLLIKSIRVEQVQDISESDAIAEGMTMVGPAALTNRTSFAKLWDSINAKRGFGWEVNPWVWVIDYDVIKQKTK